jgi:hypothetical protein
MMTSSVLWQYFQLKFWNSKAFSYGEEVHSPLSTPMTTPPHMEPPGRPPATIAPARMNEV